MDPYLFFVATFFIGWWASYFFIGHFFYWLVGILFHIWMLQSGFLGFLGVESFFWKPSLNRNECQHHPFSDIYITSTHPEAEHQTTHSMTITTLSVDWSVRDISYPGSILYANPSNVCVRKTGAGVFSTIWGLSAHRRGAFRDFHPSQVGSQIGFPTQPNPPKAFEQFRLTWNVNSPLILYPNIKLLLTNFNKFQQFDGTDWFSTNFTAQCCRSLVSI